jgi:hypothetical protein
MGFEGVIRCIGCIGLVTGINEMTLNGLQWFYYQVNERNQLSSNFSFLASSVLMKVE